MPVLVDPYMSFPAVGGGGSGVKTAVGSFLTGTATAGNNVTVTSLVDGSGAALGQVSFVLFWWHGLSASGNQLTRADLRMGIGFAVSSSDRRNAGGQSADNVPTMSTDHEIGDESCIRVLSTTGTLAGALDVVTLDVDGFTLVVDTQFTADLRVHYMAFSGLTNAITGNTDEPAATGTVAITGLGFAPDVLIFGTAAATVSAPGQAGHHITSFGVAVRSSGQWVTIFRDQDAVGVDSSHSLAQSDSVTGRLVFNNVTVVALANVDSFDADGFTLNWTARAVSGVHYFYAALQGGNWAAGELLTRTDGNDIAVSSGATTPTGVLFASAARAETAGTGIGVAVLSIGAANSASNRVNTFAAANGFSSSSLLFAAQRDDAVYTALVVDGTAGTTPTIRALMDVASFDSTGFTCVMDDTDTGASWVGYLAVH